MVASEKCAVCLCRWGVGGRVDVMHFPSLISPTHLVVSSPRCTPSKRRLFNHSFAAKQCVSPCVVTQVAQASLAKKKGPWPALAVKPGRDSVPVKPKKSSCGENHRPRSANKFASKSNKVRQRKIKDKRAELNSSCVCSFATEIPRPRTFP